MKNKIEFTNDNTNLSDIRLHLSAEDESYSIKLNAKPALNLTIGQYNIKSEDSDGFRAYFVTNIKNNKKLEGITSIDFDGQIMFMEMAHFWKYDLEGLDGNEFSTIEVRL